MAKRRFITFLTEIDPLLIDVMPDEKPPIGFPLDRRGNPICAKCNTVVGCSRPILDQHKLNIKMQLYENEEFHEPEKLRQWIRNVLANQRCIWGMHMPITKAQAKPFLDWFQREENRGFFPYDSIGIMQMVKEVIIHYHQIVQELIEKKEEVEASYYNSSASKAIALKEVYEQFSGDTFKYEIWCTRDNEICNQRRVADNGNNHKHEFQIDPPTMSDTNSLQDAIQLRQECQRLGINPCTGIVKTLDERCEMYRTRIANHLFALQQAEKAKIRNENRFEIHRQEKKNVRQLSQQMLTKQLQDACQSNAIEKIILLIRRGSNPNTESIRGMTPLLTMIINETSIEKVETLITLQADMNKANKYGITPMMMASRMKDSKMIHILMKSGASALQKVSRIMYYY
jgi:hypothetical protein